MLDHERARWTGSAAAAGLAPGAADAALAVATLLGDPTDEGIRAALRRAGVEPATGRTADAVAWVRAHLPVVPRLAELLVSRTLAASEELTAACTRDLRPGEAFAMLAFATEMGLDRPVAERDVTGELIEAAASALPTGQAAGLPALMRAAAGCRARRARWPCRCWTASRTGWRISPGRPAATPNVVRR